MHPLRLTRKREPQAKVDQEVVSVSTKILAVVRPNRLILFGSAAEGKMTDQSDLDFLIIMKSELAIKEGQLKLRPLAPLSRYPIDLVWVTQERFDKMKELGGVCLIAHEDGKVLFAGATVP